MRKENLYQTYMTAFLLFIAYLIMSTLAIFMTSTVPKVDKVIDKGYDLEVSQVYKEDLIKDANAKITKDGVYEYNNAKYYVYNIKTEKGTNKVAVKKTYVDTDLYTFLTYFSIFITVLVLIAEFLLSQLSDKVKKYRKEMLTVTIVLCFLFACFGPYIISSSNNMGGVKII